MNNPRLDISKHFTMCQACKFTYLPMSKKADSNCPKCSKDIINEDELYLQNEVKMQEEISHLSLFDDAPRFSQDEYKTML